MTTSKVFIYCDDPSHDEEIAVTNFVQIEPVGSTYPDAGRWNEIYTSAAPQGRRESGTTLIGDRLPDRSYGVLGEVHSLIMDDHPDRYLVRSRYRLECRKCRGRNPVVAREGKLFDALNKLAAAGVSRVSLRGLSAII